MSCVHVWASVTWIRLHLNLCQDVKSSSSSLWKVVSSGGIRERVEMKTPNSASQPVTLWQERDSDQRKIWCECLRDSKSCKCLLHSCFWFLVCAFTPLVSLPPPATTDAPRGSWDHGHCPMTASFWMIRSWQTLSQPGSYPRRTFTARSKLCRYSLLF